MPVFASGASDARAICRKLRSFKEGQGARALQLVNECVWPPFVMGMLLLVASFAIAAPTRVRGILSWFAPRRQRRKQTEGFKWTSAKAKLLLAAAQNVPKGIPGRWSQIAAAVSDDCTAYLAESEFKRITAPKKEPTRVPRAPAPLPIPKEKVAPAPVDVAEEHLWTPEEQKFLETALKKVGKQEEDRWEKIASLVPTRSKKECIRRCKEIAKLVRGENKEN